MRLRTLMRRIINALASVLAEEKDVRALSGHVGHSARLVENRPTQDLVVRLAFFSLNDYMPPGLHLRSIGQPLRIRTEDRQSRARVTRTYPLIADNLDQGVLLLRSKCHLLTIWAEDRRPYNLESTRLPITPANSGPSRLSSDVRNCPSVRGKPQGRSCWVPRRIHLRGNASRTILSHHFPDFFASDSLADPPDKSRSVGRGC